MYLCHEAARCGIQHWHADVWGSTLFAAACCRNCTAPHCIVTVIECAQSQSANKVCVIETAYAEKLFVACSGTLDVVLETDPALAADSPRIKLLLVHLTKLAEDPSILALTTEEAYQAQHSLKLPHQAPISTHTPMWERKTRHAAAVWSLCCTFIFCCFAPVHACCMQKLLPHKARSDRSLLLV